MKPCGSGGQQPYAPAECPPRLQAEHGSGAPTAHTADLDFMEEWKRCGGAGLAAGTLGPVVNPDGVLMRCMWRCASQGRRVVCQPGGHGGGLRVPLQVSGPCKAMRHGPAMRQGSHSVLTQERQDPFADPFM